MYVLKLLFLILILLKFDNFFNFFFYLNSIRKQHQAGPLSTEVHAQQDSW